MKRLILSGMLGLLATIYACTSKEAAPSVTPSDPPNTASQGTTLAVTVDAAGFHPDSLHAPANLPVHLVFTRVSDEGCGQQVVFPTLDIRRDLPLNTAVSVDFTMPASGSVAFTCGMNMLRGSVVVQ